MFKRIYTISYDPSSKSVSKYGKRGVPSLRFSGIWLTKKASLNVGDKVLVLVDTGKIAVIKIPKENNEQDNAANKSATKNQNRDNP